MPDPRLLTASPRLNPNQLAKEQEGLERRPSSSSLGGSA